MLVPVCVFYFFIEFIRGTVVNKIILVSSGILLFLIFLHGNDYEAAF